jgi:Domain of unknown function (DUF5597)
MAEVVPSRKTDANRLKFVARIPWPCGVESLACSGVSGGATKVNEETLTPFAMNYELIGPMQREIARLNFEGKLQAVAEEKGRVTQSLKFEAWEITVSYGLGQFGPGNNPPGNPESVGGALAARLGETSFW